MTHHHQSPYRFDYRVFPWGAVRADTKREREEARMLKGILNRGAEGRGATAVGSWMDPDWVPEMLSVGAGGKGRSVRSAGVEGDMPVVGYGRKNPNERRRRK